MGKRFSIQISAFPTALTLTLVFMSVLGINAQRIYDNGPLATGTVARNGTAAPAGAQYSEVSNNFGETAVSNDFAGFNCARIATATARIDLRCADDFNVPVGQTWTISQVVVFAYQTGSTGNPITAANLRIWNGIPGAGGTVIFGDTTTNRLTASTDSGLFRIFNSGPPGNTVPGTTRRIWQVAINAAPAQVLTAGNYWVDFQIETATGGNFSPSVTITGTRGVPGWNARQSSGGTTWTEIFDDGAPPTAVNVVQDFPFKLNGTISGAPAIPSHRRMDFDGDNRSDAVVARAANATSQSTWAISYSSNIPSTTTPFGTGVGIPGGDIATPEDFDGDGKTDIAVWRSNPFGSGFSNFYILQSSNQTVRVEQFGKPGDDPTVIDDYDGDGRADLAVFRGAVTAGDPCGGSSVWYFRPSGTADVSFAYSCWGSPGDKPYPGDFDGDRRADFSVVRNNGGAAQILQRRTTAGVRYVNYGNFADRFVTGDFDADGRIDLTVVRTTGTVLNWIITKSGNGQVYSFNLGNGATDYNVPGDYDGDNKTDYSLWRSGTGGEGGSFYLLKTFTSPVFFKFGQSAGNLTAPDYPVAAYQVH